MLLAKGPNHVLQVAAVLLRVKCRVFEVDSIEVDRLGEIAQVEDLVAIQKMLRKRSIGRFGNRRKAWTQNFYHLLSLVK